MGEFMSDQTQLVGVKAKSKVRSVLKVVAFVGGAVVVVTADMALASPVAIPLGANATAQHTAVVGLATALIATMSFATGGGAVLAATRAIIGRVAGIVRGMFS